MTAGSIEDEGHSRTAHDPLDRLRARFLVIARRRVHADAVEDVVQSALQCVHERKVNWAGTDVIDGLPPLAWCLSVLRNTIGNYYQKTRVARGRWETASNSEWAAGSLEATPIEALDSKRAVEEILRALNSMDRDDPECSRYLRTLSSGETPAALARSIGTTESILYRRVYRCRQKLRQALRARGVLA